MDYTLTKLLYHVSFPIVVCKLTFPQSYLVILLENSMKDCGKLYNC
ncbi:hypothetical protein BH10CHL1_BH10CHL1_19570 [soil metagenome]